MIFFKFLGFLFVILSNILEVEMPKLKLEATETVNWIKLTSFINI